MINQDVFMDTLRAVKEIIRTSAKPLTKEEMLGYFSEMELSDEQKNMVNYLLRFIDQRLTIIRENY